MLVFGAVLVEQTRLDLADDPATLDATDPVRPGGVPVDRERGLKDDIDGTIEDQLLGLVDRAREHAVGVQALSTPMDILTLLHSEQIGRCRSAA